MANNDDQSLFGDNTPQFNANEYTNFGGGRGGAATNQPLNVMSADQMNVQSDYTMDGLST
jgi:hypothetical protein